MTAYTAREWSDLFVASAGASAALAGLIFVAVSINIEQILKYPGLPERALGTLMMLLGVVVVSILGLAPGLSGTELGTALLIEGMVFGATGGLLGAISLRRAKISAQAATTRLAVYVLGTVPFAIGGISLLAEAGGGLYWTLAGIIGALVGSVLNAWVLLVEIRR